MAILNIQDMQKTYSLKKPLKPAVPVYAVRGLSLALEPGETLAIVGESGCGKSTLAKVLMKIEGLTAGQVNLDGKDLQQIPLKELSNSIQMIFQDPYSSLNPRHKIARSIAEPLVIKGTQSHEEIQKKVREVIATVGLREEILERYPHMLSGGQRQRVGIARALMTSPKILICDEPVSALDVSVQAQVLNLLLDLQLSRKMSYLFISHDLGVVRFVAHKVAVMYLGKIVECGSVDEIFTNPRHPYTQLLLKSSSLYSGARLDIQYGTELPSPLHPPLGCGFQTRCPWVTDACRKTTPELQGTASIKTACHNLDKIPAFQNL